MIQPHRCPECGATLKDGSTCQSIFDEFLVLEFTDPAYGQVHMLTVACFMVQHGRYSDPALNWIRRQLEAYLEAGVPIEQIRREAGQDASQGKRNWKVTRQPDEPPPPLVTWSMTIADVAAGYLDEHGQPSASLYCDLVRQWGRVTCQEMQVPSS